MTRLHFQCNGCKRRIACQTRMAGRFARCPSCGNFLQVPVPEALRPYEPYTDLYWSQPDRANRPNVMTRNDVSWDSNWNKLDDFPTQLNEVTEDFEKVSGTRDLRIQLGRPDSQITVDAVGTRDGDRMSVSLGSLDSYTSGKLRSYEAYDARIKSVVRPRANQPLRINLTILVGQSKVMPSFGDRGIRVQSATKI